LKSDFVQVIKLLQKSIVLLINVVLRESKYVFNVALTFNQDSFLSTLLDALSINQNISASTGVVFAVDELINGHTVLSNKTVPVVSGNV